MRHLHAVHRRVSDRRAAGTLPTRFKQMHRVSHDREAGIDPGRNACRDRTTNLRLRHLPGCVPVESQSSCSSAPEFAPRPGLVNPALAWLAEMSAEEFRDTFRGSAIRRTKRSGLRRNVAIAMGNSGNAEFLPMLDQMLVDEDESVAESARWAKERLRALPDK